MEGIGKAIKVTASVLSVIIFIIGVALAFSVERIFQDVPGDIGLLISLAYLIGCGIAAWFVYIILGGFGQLVDNSDRTVSLLTKIVAIEANANSQNKDNFYDDFDIDIYLDDDFDEDIED